MHPAQIFTVGIETIIIVLLKDIIRIEDIMTIEERKVLEYTLQTAESYQKLFDINYKFIIYLNNHWFYSIVLKKHLINLLINILEEFKKAEKS